jgi:mRNA-degrading endonuclease RelE of RelBE toxin-antitoxin system
MNYNVISTNTFKRELKPLLKKLEADLLENPEMGVALSINTRKVRTAIASKNKGKSGGARVIVYNVLVSVSNTTIFLHYPTF